jgi:hypothetical protein
VATISEPIIRVTLGPLALVMPAERADMTIMTRPCGASTRPTVSIDLPRP